MRGAAESFVRGLFGTRQQVTYAVVGAYVYILVKAAMAAQTVADHVALLNAAWPAMGIALGAWLGDKVREQSAAPGTQKTVETRVVEVNKPVNGVQP